MPRVTVARNIYVCKVTSTPSGFDIRHLPIVAFDDAQGLGSGQVSVMRDGGCKVVPEVSTLTIPPAAPVPVNLFYDGERNIYVYDGEEYLYDQLQRLVGFPDPYG